MKEKIRRLIGLATGKNLALIGKYTRPFIFPIILYTVILGAGSLLGVASALVIKNLVDTATAAVAFSDIYRPALLMLAVALTSIMISAVTSVYAMSLSERYSINLRQSLFAHTCRTQWLPLSAYHSGDLLTRMTSDVNAVVKGMVGTIPDMFSLMVRFIASFIVLMILDPYLAIFALVLGPLSIIVVRIIAHRMSYLYKKIQETESRFRSFIQESMVNVTVIKVFSGETANVNRLKDLHHERMKWVYKRNRLSVFSSVALSLGYYLGYLGALFRGVQGMITKTTSFGDLTAFLQLVSQIQGPIVSLAQTMPTLVGMLASADRIRQIEELPLEEPSEKLTAATVSLKLTNVSFYYDRIDEANNVVLDNVNMYVNPGELISITGISGAGKTTLLRLLLALTQPNHGTINFIDEKGYKHSASPSTRSLISYVPQGNNLISGTIADNLRLAKADASDAEMKKALTLATAKFVFTLPNALDTVIGERGVGLSEGQAQRIAIARALLRGAPLIILDEATSALDLTLEKQLFDNLRQLNLTILAITHRTYALAISDRVYNLENKRLELANE